MPMIQCVGQAGGQTPDKKVWDGTISAISLDTDSYKDLADSCFVKTSNDAYIRCVDGRPSAAEKDNLGPQIAGGSPTIAIPYHIASGGGSFVNDLTAVHSKSLGYKAGAHCDDHAQDTSVGCGAIDKLPQIVQKMTEPGAQAITTESAKTLLDNDFDKYLTSQVFGGVGKIVNSGYLKELPSGQEILRDVEEAADKNAVEVATGPHIEGFIIINTVPGETFDRNNFWAKTNHKAQAFNYDLWYSRQLAKIFWQNDSDAQKKFISAQLAFNLATAMVLTDGTLQLGVRQ